MGQLASLCESVSLVSAVANAVRDICRNCVVYVCNDCHSFCDCCCCKFEWETHATHED